MPQPLLSPADRSRGRLALAVLVVVLGARPALPGDKAPSGQVDRYGALLPEGAVSRLGSTRLRGLCDSIHFSADGKTLVGLDGGCQVRIWDAASGKLLCTRPLGDGPYRTRWEIRTALSADGQTLLITEGGSLQMWDLSSGKRLEVRLPTDFRLLTRLAVSNDRRFLLLVDQVKEWHVPEGGGFGRFLIEQRFLLWDTTTGKQRSLGQDRSDVGVERMALHLSPDGKHLVSLSKDEGIRVQATETGKLLWRKGKLHADSLVFTADSQRLLVSPRGSPTEWQLWDIATGRTIQSVPAPPIGYVWTFILSPDGSKLLAPTTTDYVLWDLQAGKELQRWPGARQSGQVAFAPDGRSVVTCDTILRRWDVASGKALYPDVSPRGHIAPVRRLFFSPDGKRLVSVSEDNTLIIWDVAATRPAHIVPFGAASGDDRCDWSADGGTTNRDGWTLTPDGAAVIGVDTRLTVHRWSVAEGRQLSPYELRAARQVEERLDLRAMHVRVSRDGETLALVGWPRCPEYSYNRYAFSFWDVETGRLRRWGGDPGKSYRGSHVVLSPDGRFVVSDGWLFDTRTGTRRQMRFARNGDEASGGVVAFSPEGRLLATIGKIGHVWEVASGQPVLDVPQVETHRSSPDSRHAAFAPDGRRCAFATPHHLLVCDLPTGEIIVKRPVPDAMGGDVDWASGGVAFAPDGRSVATGCRDGTILLWDVPPIPLGKRLVEREATTLLEDLARDTTRGWAAVWRFQEDPETAVPYLRKRLPPVPRVEVSWQPLIEQLDSEHFEQREAASLRLRELGRAAEDALRQALKEKPTLEQKKRIEALLSPLERSPEAVPDLRTLRAVAVLEGINTVAARRVLAEWANGLPGAPLTDEAARAQARLRWRPVWDSSTGTR